LEKLAQNRKDRAVARESFECTAALNKGGRQRNCKPKEAEKDAFFQRDVYKLIDYRAVHDSNGNMN